MLRDIDRRAAIFAAKRNPLADAQQDQQYWRDDAGARVGRQQADGEGRPAHQADGCQEGALAAQPVPDDAEDEGAKRPESKAGGEQAKRGNKPGCGVETGEENLLNGRRQASEDEKVVPFEGGAC
jgi:hypothetical protein